LPAARAALPKQGFNSQFMLEVFEAHALAARTPRGTAHRLDFLRQRVLHGDHAAALGYHDVSAERFAENFGADAVLSFAHASSSAISYGGSAMSLQSSYFRVPTGEILIKAVAHARSKSVRSVIGRRCK
jgi:hypothetical protein